jgi:hypothetical protein
MRDGMTDEHMTTALCMNDLKGCQKYSMDTILSTLELRKKGVSNVLLYCDAFLFWYPFHPKLT